MSGVDVWACGGLLCDMTCSVMYQSHYSYFPYQRNILHQDNKQVTNLLINLETTYDPILSVSSGLLNNY